MSRCLGLCSNISKMGDIPVPSTSKYFSPQKATDNFSRLCQLILTICSDLLRDVLRHYIPHANLRSILDKNKTKLEKIMNSDQKKLIYPDSGGSLDEKDLDVSVLYTILRNICNITPHSKGWGNPPLKGDNSISACLEIIRIQRNHVIGHSTNGKVDDVQFQSHWNELRDAVVEIEKKLFGGNFYKQNIEVLLNCELNPIRAEMYRKEINRIQERIEDLESARKRTEGELGFKREKIENLTTSCQQIQGELGFKREKIENLTTSCQQIQDQMHLKEERINQLEKNIKEQRGVKRKNLDLSEENQAEGEMSRLKQTINEQREQINQLQMTVREEQGRLSRLENNYRGIALRMSFLSTAIPASKINVPGMTEIRLITLANFKGLWVSDYKTLKQVSFSGDVIETISNAGNGYQAITVTQSGHIIYVQENSQNIIQKKTPTGTSNVLRLSSFDIVECMHCSQISNDLLLAVSSSMKKNSTVTRYSETGNMIQEIELNDQGKSLYSKPVYITENWMGDIITSDKGKRAVVVVNRAGQHRFNYPPDSFQTEFVPGGICTDAYGHILVVNANSSVYLLDQNGILLSKILTPEQLKFVFPFTLYVNDSHIYVGGKSGRIEVYTFLKDS